MRRHRTLGLATLALALAACVPPPAQPPMYGQAPPPSSGPPSTQPPAAPPVYQPAPAPPVYQPAPAPPVYQPPPPPPPAPYQPPPPVYQPAPPPPPPPPPPPVADDRRDDRRDRAFDRASDWDKLGERWVTGGADRDVIRVGKRDGRFVALAIVVEHSALEMFDMVVLFGDGSRYAPPVRAVFGPGTTSRVIDLPGGARDVQAVEFRYGNLPGGGRAQVELWGLDGRDDDRDGRDGGRGRGHGRAHGRGRGHR